MFKKFFILAFLFGASTAFAQDCNLLNSLQIPDTITACRRDTLWLQPQTSFVKDTAWFNNKKDTSFVYEWSDGTRNPFYIFPYSGNIFGKIWVEITDTINICDPRRDTIIVDTFPTPKLVSKLKVDTTLCFGDTLLLNLGETEYVNEFYWLNPEILSGNQVRDSVFEVVFDSAKHSTHTYHYIAVYIGHCSRDYSAFPFVYDTAFVFFANRPIVDFVADTILCYDEEGFKLTALSENNFLLDKYKFSWLDSLGRSVSTQNTFTVNYENQGLQVVKVWNNICKDTVTDSVVIKYWPKEWTESKLIKDTGICEKMRVRLDASVPFPRTTYRWADDTNNTNPERIVFPGSYTVRLTDSAGCKLEFTANVRSDDCTPKLEMPNVFTPNDDGINDFFRPTTLEQLKNFQLRIFNRWGGVVYKYDGDPSDGSWKGWDGRNGNALAPEGMYFWVVKYDDLFDRNFEQRGTVTLLR
jgi:gliding motility-associated-like protein